ncbi:MAG: hypothetical protein LBN08_01580 [Lactobacillales bacterium]|jgi:hypothetical protein|nr:hypothetical protein [Lactobacillales bacterium]
MKKFAIIALLALFLPWVITAAAGDPGHWIVDPDPYQSARDYSEVIDPLAPPIS